MSASSIHDVSCRKGADTTAPPKNSVSANNKPLYRTITPESWNDLGDGCSLGWWPQRFVADHETLMAVLLKEVDLQQHSIVMFGKSLLQRRLVGYCAGPGLAYTYAGLTLPPQAVGTTLAAIQHQAEMLAGESFNSCLLNLYRSGDDQMGWHADNEKVYSRTPTIACVSLGSQRDFVMRRNIDSKDQVRLALGCGDLLVMRGRTQLCWQHSVPRTAKLVGPRLSLTFRRLQHPGVRGLHRDAPPQAASSATPKRQRLEPS